MKVKVFLSSTMTGELRAERTAVRALFESAQHLTELCELFAIEDHASSRPIETAFLEEVADSDLVVVLLGTELRPAVVQEFDQAEANGVRILCYIHSQLTPSDALKTFIIERAYKYHVARFADETDLLRRVRADLLGDFVRGYRGTAQAIALQDEGDSYVIRQLKTPYASSAYFSPADVQELLSKPEYSRLDVDQLIALAMLNLEDSGNYLGALLLLEAAILRAPNNWIALSNRGMVLKEMGLIYHAQTSYEAALAHNPGSATVHYNLGICYYTNRDYRQALHHFGRALEIEPNKPSATSRMAATYLQLEEPEAALEWAKKSLELDPSETSIANMALALGLAKQRDEAMDFAGRLEGDPARIHELKAFIEKHNGNYESCIAELDGYSKLAPTSNRAASLKYESLIALERHDQAEAYFAELEGSHLLTPFDYNNYGMQYMSAFGPTDFAASCFRKAVARDPSCMPCWQNLQYCLAEKGDLEGAITACDQTLEVNPFDQKSIQNKALCLRQLGRFTELVTLMAGKTAGILGPISGTSPEEFVQQMLSSPVGKQLGMLDELAKKLRAAGLDPGTERQDRGE